MTNYTAAPARSPEVKKLGQMLDGAASPSSGLARLEAMHSDADTGLACTGQIHIGVFFDGTGNNKKLDYGDNARPLPRAEWKHSNVARLFNAWPEGDRMKGTVTTGLYKYYIPGVGTPFPAVGDAGTGLGKTLGSATAWNGETRILWGLIQVMNALHDYYYREDLIDAGDGESPCLAGKMAMDLKRDPDFKRRALFQVVWIPKLKAKLATATAVYRKPRLVRINLSIFGFSRGAAEARAFANWLYELCDPASGQESAFAFAGIPLVTQFMGLFDTVASVGVAGLWDVSEGRQSWADHNLQIPPAVQQCVHMVAAHEQRACFPLDSVRVEGQYPANCQEYVFPGAHSDVGGGYSRKAQGKSDDYARIPGFAMYCMAREAGVPFLTLKQMLPPARDGLTVPGGAAGTVFRDFERYMAGVRFDGQSLEDQVRAHMRQYLSWRQRFRLDAYRAAVAAVPKEDREKMVQTQRHFFLVLAGLSDQLQERIDKPADAGLHLKPLDQPYVPGRFETLMSLLPDPPLVVFELIGLAARNAAWRTGELKMMNEAEAERKATQLAHKLNQWRNALATRSPGQAAYPKLRDAAAPDRDALNLIEALLPDNQAIPQAVQDFLANYIHDSMAGFAAHDKVDEFLWNGIGMAKFRRIYFGDRGDRLLAEDYAASNKTELKRFQAGRSAQRAEATEAWLPVTAP